MLKKKTGKEGPVYINLSQNYLLKHCWFILLYNDQNTLIEQSPLLKNFNKAVNNI